MYGNLKISNGNFALMLKKIIKEIKTGETAIADVHDGNEYFTNDS